jgi:RNase P/RNase MRP subunit p29
VKQGKWTFYNSDNLIEQTREYRQGELIKIDGQTIKSRKERRADRDLKRTKTQ